MDRYYADMIHKHHLFPKSIMKEIYHKFNLICANDLNYITMQMPHYIHKRLHKKIDKQITPDSIKKINDDWLRKIIIIQIKWLEKHYPKILEDFRNNKGRKVVRLRKKLGLFLENKLVLLVTPKRVEVKQILTKSKLSLVETKKKDLFDLDKEYVSAFDLMPSMEFVSRRVE